MNFSKYILSFVGEQWHFLSPSIMFQIFKKTAQPETLELLSESQKLSRQGMSRRRIRQYSRLMNAQWGAYCLSQYAPHGARGKNPDTKLLATRAAYIRCQAAQRSGLPAPSCISLICLPQTAGVSTSQTTGPLGDEQRRGYFHSGLLCCPRPRVEEESSSENDVSPCENEECISKKNKKEVDWATAKQKDKNCATSKLVLLY